MADQNTEKASLLSDFLSRLIRHANFKNLESYNEMNNQQNRFLHVCDYYKTLLNSSTRISKFMIFEVLNKPECFSVRHSKLTFSNPRRIETRVASDAAENPALCISRIFVNKKKKIHNCC